MSGTLLAHGAARNRISLRLHASLAPADAHISLSTQLKLRVSWGDEAHKVSQRLRKEAEAADNVAAEWQDRSMLIVNTDVGDVATGPAQAWDRSRRASECGSWKDDDAVSCGPSQEASASCVGPFASEATVAPQLTRRLVLWRGVAALLSLALVVSGIAVAAQQSSPPRCYPLPDVANGTNHCQSGFVSLQAGKSCRPDCDFGFRAEGRFHCAADGSLAGTPRCLEA